VLTTASEKPSYVARLSEVFSVGSVPSPNHGNRCRLATNDDREVHLIRKIGFSEVELAFQSRIVGAADNRDPNREKSLPQVVVVVSVSFKSASSVLTQIFQSPHSHPWWTTFLTEMLLSWLAHEFFNPSTEKFPS
jgi:hypothetical protein